VTEDETESTESPAGGVTIIINKSPQRETKTPDNSFSLMVLEQDNRFPLMMYLAQKSNELDDDIIITERTERMVLDPISGASTPQESTYRSS
jgi:hypothetical protein